MSTKNKIIEYLERENADEVPVVITGIEIEKIDSEHLLSGLRMLRELRKEGKIDYIVISRSKSLYKIWLNNDFEFAVTEGIPKEITNLPQYINFNGLDKD